MYFPEQRRVFLDAKAGKREAQADQPSGETTYTMLIDLQRSETVDCSDRPN